MSTQEDKISTENRKELFGLLRDDDDELDCLTVEEKDEFVTDWDHKVSDQYDGRGGP